MKEFIFFAILFGIFLANANIENQLQKINNTFEKILEELRNK